MVFPVFGFGMNPYNPIKMHWNSFVNEVVYMSSGTTLASFLNQEEPPLSNQYTISDLSKSQRFHGFPCSILISLYDATLWGG